MSTTETDSGAVSQYVPFTPFQESYAFEPESFTPALFESVPAVTPFVSEYAGVAAQSPQSAELRDLLFELYDEQFNDTLSELAHEAWEAVSQRAEPFGETGATQASEQFLQEWSEPVRQAAGTMLENMAQAVSEHDLASMSESEVDQFFERFEPKGTGLEPHFENFLGGLWNKVKSVAKGALSIAAKGLTLIPGLSGLISKLKALVRPLLDRVLRTAIDKLPPTLRPLARQLAQRVLGTSGQEMEGEDFAAAPAAPDVAAAQQQFDFEAATLLFASDEADQEIVVNEAAYAAEREDGLGVAQLQEARARFVDELEAGVDPEQAMEQFIPVVMAVLPIARTVIGMIGRQRVVNMLAKILAGSSRATSPRRLRHSSRARSSTPGCGCCRSRRRRRRRHQPALRVARRRADCRGHRPSGLGARRDGVRGAGAARGGGHRRLPRRGGRELPAAGARARSCTRRPCRRRGS